MTAGRSDKVRKFKMDGAVKLFVVGALLAGALFLMEAGIAEIFIAMDQECRASIGSVRLAPDPFDVCAPEWQWYLARAVSRGIPWVINLESSPLIGWLTMGVLYSLFGGISANTFRGRAVLVFIVVQVGLTATLMGLGYFRQFIA